MSERGYLLDASALLAFFYDEPGSTRVAQVLKDAAISAVNLTEVVAKLHDRALSPEVIALNLADTNLRVLRFDEPIAITAGNLRERTRVFGLSLADRACLATAALTGRTAVTADGDWRPLASDFDIEFIR